VSFGENRRPGIEREDDLISCTTTHTKRRTGASEAERERGRVVCTQLSMQGIEGNINGLPARPLGSLPPYPG
jgi:hypothetical protein